MAKVTVETTSGDICYVCAENDGPALRAAFRPVAGAQEEWLQALGWPTSTEANPCDGDHFVWPDPSNGGYPGCKCDSGRVTSVQFDRNVPPLPSYTLQPVVGNLTELDSLCALRGLSSRSLGSLRGGADYGDSARRQVAVQHGSVRHPADCDWRSEAAGVLVRPYAAFLAVPRTPCAQGLTMGILLGGRYMYNTGLSGTVPSSIGKLKQLVDLCAPRGLPSGSSGPLRVERF
jgi:hypothetical protein